MFFSELEDGQTFTDRTATPYEKVELYVAVSRLTNRAEHYNAISLWDFTECFFREDDFVYDYI